MNKIVLNSRSDDEKGARTWLEEVSPNDYVVHLREEWMPIYINGEMEDIASIDFDGGPFLSRGSVIEGKKIKDILFRKGEGFHIIFE